MRGAENSHVRAFKQSKLKPGEEVLVFLEGWIGEMMGKGDKQQRNGMLIVTSTRVSFYRKGWFGEVYESIPLTKVTSIETSSFMGHRVLTVHTSHDELKFKTFESADLFQSAHDAIDSRREGAKPTAASVPTNDPIEQLRALGELRSSGILSEEEFASKKADILARM